MAKRGKSKVDPDAEEEEQKLVVELSSSDEGEGNEDLSLGIVKRAREREAKRKRDEDLAEVERRANQRPEVVVNLSSSSSDEVEVVADWREETVMVSELKKKRKVKKKKKNGNKEEREKELKAEQPLLDQEALISEAAVKLNDIVTTGERLDMFDVVKTRTDGTLEKAGKAGECSVIEAMDWEVVDRGDPAIMVASEPNKMVVEEVGVPESAIFLKLLRRPRYFDPPDSHCDTCYNCGNEGHTAANCTSEKRKKPCFVCGNYGHNARQCTQGQDCFICKRRGHFAKNCPEKEQGGSQNFKMCLLCGDSGHDMSSCRNDYAPADLKEIQCYICKKYGHLCCADMVDAEQKEVSCYNCGQAGHSGAGCAKLRGETNEAASPTLCFKCGQEGHFARGCTMSAKSGLNLGEVSTPKRSRKKSRDLERTVSKSVPPEIGRPKKKKMKQCDERQITGSSKPKRNKGGWFTDDNPSSRKSKRGGWIPDESRGPPNKGVVKANSWQSPSTPGKWTQNTPKPATRSWHSTSESPFNKHNIQLGSRGSHPWTPHGFTASSASTPQGFTDSRAWTPHGFTASSAWTPQGFTDSRAWTPHGFTASRFANGGMNQYGRFYGRPHF